MCNSLIQHMKTLRYHFIATFAFLLYASSALAGPAPAISQFDVLAVTSAAYNPVLPSPLTPYTVLGMDWDVVTGPSQFKQSIRSHGGGWIAFVTETYGYRVNGQPPTATYNGGVAYFGTYNLVDSGGTLYGYYDEYYCSPCNSQASFSASTVSINTYRTWVAYMYVK